MTPVAVYLDRRIKPGDYRLKLMEILAKFLKNDHLDLKGLKKGSERSFFLPMKLWS